MRHTVLAPDWHAALALEAAIKRRGWEARALTRNEHNIVLIHAPTEVLNHACKRISFEMGVVRNDRDQYGDTGRRAA
jgi:hypothetical protein